ncbi:MAG TPA: hypothetical protein PKJ47_13885, partial [Candidatus Limiplasma sp.]|nr:hypothetical protein [Candidatus Limiplasma sp.]
VGRLLGNVRFSWGSAAQGQGPCRGLGQNPKACAEASKPKRANSSQGYETSGQQIAKFTDKPFSFRDNSSVATT